MESQEGQCVGTLFRRGPSTDVHPGSAAGGKEPTRRAKKSKARGRRGKHQRRALCTSGGLPAPIPHSLSHHHLPSVHTPFPPHQHIAVLCERVSHFYGGSAGQLCEQQKRTPTPCYSPRSNYAGQGVGWPTGDPSCRHGWTETVRIETATSVITDAVVLGVIGTLGFLNFSQFELWNRKAGL